MTGVWVLRTSGQPSTAPFIVLAALLGAVAMVAIAFLLVTIVS